MEIRELRAVGRGRRLHVSQSALSQTVQSLERQLGVDLLIRHHAGVRATDAGRVLLREARSLIDHHDQAMATIGAATGSSARAAGLLRIGVSARSAEIAQDAGVHLHRLAGLRWIGFARSDTPAWHDQVTAILRGHGVGVEGQPGDDRPVTAEVKLAAVGTGKAFALASPGWGQPLPAGIDWHPLIGDPIVRRTWAVWRADARQRDLAALIAALDVTATEQ